MKAISLDMYFGRQAQADVRVQKAPTGAPRTRKKAVGTMRGWAAEGEEAPRQ